METLAVVVMLLIGAVMLGTAITGSRREAPTVIYVSSPESENRDGGCLVVLALLVLLMALILVVWIGSGVHAAP